MRARPETDGTAWPPPGFTDLRRGAGRIALVRDDLRGWYEAGGLANPEDALRRDADPRRATPESGRGATARITPPGGAPLVLRKYRRGGALAGVLPDAFFGVGRMTAELSALARARARSVPSARPAGLILERVAGPWWRGYLLTEEIAGARTLDRALGALAPGSAGARDLAARAVAAVRAMHDAGIVHADLNLRNLLVREEEVLLIDLDGADLPEEVTPADRFANLSRLDRSYCKLFGDSGPLTSADRRSLLGIYSRGDTALQADLEGRIGSHLRRLERHRLLWRR